MSPGSVPRGGGVVLEGRYRVDGVLARGGMSTVHRGMDLRLDRPVAVKVMDPALADDPAFVRRFEREARAAARLAHPGIVAVHDQGRDRDGTVFLVLELVEGGTLRDVLRQHGRLRPETALTVVEQVVTALGVAHAHGLVHRDVKPENVLVATDGAVKVADFGLVAALRGRGADGSAGPDDPSGFVLGTVAYLAPEQLRDGVSDERSDLYSAGVVLYELLTGVPPHGGVDDGAGAADAAAVARRHVRVDVPPPSERVAGVPPALDRLVLAATRRDPDRRPRSTGSFLVAARAARAEARLPFSPVPVPAPRQATAAGARTTAGRPGGTTRVAPRTGTRRIDLDDLDDLRDDLHDDDLDAVDDRPPARAARRRPASDDLDDRIERLERRRARTRSRRWFAAWTLAVSAATVAAGMVGWAAGLP